MGEGGRNVDRSEAPGGATTPSNVLRREDHALVVGEHMIEVPRELARDLGLAPGERLRVVSREGRFEIRPNIHSLARVYVEPTSRCNLACRTCVRNTWQETVGDMSPLVFERLVSQLGRFPHLQSVMFGGFGEPTVHPHIVPMIQAVKALGLRAEMVSNGTLLAGALLDGIAASGLDVLWVSFDGADEASYEAIRVGADYPAVVENVLRLKKAVKELGRGLEIGIAFVVMRRNLDDLKRLDRLVESVGARRVSVSNVLPYSADMEKQMVCRVSLSLELHTAVAGKTQVSLPRLDVNRETREAILSLFRGHHNLNLMGNPMWTEIKSCRFIRDRCTFVRWDGKVSPCMGLLHPHTTFLHGNQRRIEPYFLGDVAQGSLVEIWGSEAYRAFREKVDVFDFSPCHACGGCNLGDTNGEDCAGNAFPTCGGCLWAQGVIQCP